MPNSSLSAPVLTHFRNGNRLVVVPNEQAESIGLAIVTDGSRHEPKPLVAHITEHLVADKGYFPNFAQFARRIDRLMREFNAEISREWMVLYCRLFPNDFHDGLQMMARMLLRQKFTDRLFREIQGLVLEKKDGEDRVIDLLHDLTDETVYRGHALAARMVGTREELLGVSLADVEAWHAHLLSQPITVCVVGHVDPLMASRLIGRLFGRLPHRPIKPGPSFISRQRQLRVRPVRWPIQLVNGAVATVSPYGLGHPDRLILSAINNHLGGLERWASRLSLRMIGDEKTRLAYHASTSVWHHRDCGELSFQTAVEPDQVEHVLSIYVEELRRLKEGVLTEPELETVRKFLIDGSAQRHHDVTRSACFYAQQAHVTGTMIPHHEFVEAVHRQVTRANIQRVARRVFRRDRTSVILLGPTHRLRLDQVSRVFAPL